MPHTPAPWYLSQTGRYVRHNMAGMTGLNICDLEVFGGTGDEASANARLIAAAPDLLEACQAVMEFLKEGTPVYPGALIQDQVFNAITKATQES